MRKILLGISLLMLLSACGQRTTSSPVTVPPTERIAPSPDVAILMSTSTPSPTSTANADVTYVRAVQATDGSWTFYVTVSHSDTGWDDYADGWDVLT